jgi:hypothetical protein
LESLTLTGERQRRSPNLLGETKMTKSSLGFIVFLISIFTFCMAFVFGPAAMEGHHVLAILLLSMFGMGIGATNL